MKKSDVLAIMKAVKNNIKDNKKEIKPSENVSTALPDGFFYGLEKQLKSIHRQLQGKLWNNYYWNRENHRMKSKKELFERMEAVENRLDRIEEELSKLTK
jgi:fido (protein-threonine AMPylation protein)